MRLGLIARSRQRTAGLVLAVVLAAGSAACGPLPLTRPGQTPRPTPTPMPTFDPDLTGFDGIVVDEAGNPVPDVRVVIIEGGSRGTATTTAEGTFFDRGTPGTLEISTHPEGYQEQELTVVVAPNEIVDIRIVLVAED